MSVQTRRKYTDEFRQDAVNLVLEQGYKASEAARNLGINEGMLRRWIKNAAGIEGVESVGAEGLTREQARIRELEREVKRLQMEREILKKATAFFVKESS